MGNPQNFSFDVPQRCQMLIDELWPKVSEKRESGSLPLNASFLLAVSTPMINLPIERIWKAATNRAVGHLNDSVLDKRLATAIRQGIGSDLVANACFYRPHAWRYHYSPKGAGLPDLSLHGLPQSVETALAEDAAIRAAGALDTETFCGILRNGLAHGGILYLDSAGRTTHGAPVRMFCFVSTKQQKRNVVGLHFLRIGMKDYREFLKLWADWLKNSSAQVGLPSQALVTV
ncbi:hypothetical protein CN193_24820 [Sinorhizobium meliloti]|uniref:hypothetical protein n=1 Tax=Rhizobium meliloti TaxID=382 RepID=UPI000FDB6C26|nr:hypothetical protein [Sinorhizobium meliloti]RVI98119.1 hypothetical protein CN193_24820 [Sinorhizobium meliloti]